MREFVRTRQSHWCEKVPRGRRQKRLFSTVICASPCNGKGKAGVRLKIMFFSFLSFLSPFCRLRDTLLFLDTHHRHPAPPFHTSSPHYSTTAYLHLNKNHVTTTINQTQPGRSTQSCSGLRKRGTAATTETCWSCLSFHDCIVGFGGNGGLREKHGAVCRRQ